MLPSLMLRNLHLMNACFSKDDRAAEQFQNLYELSKQTHAKIGGFIKYLLQGNKKQKRNAQFQPPFFHTVRVSAISSEYNNVPHYGPKTISIPLFV